MDFRVRAENTSDAAFVPRRELKEKRSRGTRRPVGVRRFCARIFPPAQRSCAIHPVLRLPTGPGDWHRPCSPWNDSAVPRRGAFARRARRQGFREPSKRARGLPVCLGIPGRVISVEENPLGMTQGRVAFGGITKDVCLAYVPGVAVGDYVVVHVGVAIPREGFGVLTRIDVKETLEKKLGVALAPYLILGACNPHLARRALELEPRRGVLLPCNVVVRELAPGKTRVEAVNPEAMADLFPGMELESVAHEARLLLRALDTIGAPVPT
ncbi:MAG TPA: DUF302 domain-containing protein [Candidatus Polarisedimenticolia bacterium]|nr:DUF302 domain-containing protein [Candidatus Polarisedimenticolia bacterium]